MRLALVTGTVTATAKDASLVGGKLLLTNVVDGDENVVDGSVVAYDTVGAGVGDRVLIAQGTAARLAAGASALPVDASIVAIIDDVTLASVAKSRVKKIPKASAGTSRVKKT